MSYLRNPSDTELIENIKNLDEDVEYLVGIFKDKKVTLRNSCFIISHSDGSHSAISSKVLGFENIKEAVLIFNLIYV